METSLLKIKDVLFISYSYLIEKGISVKTISKWKERKIGVYIKKGSRTFVSYESIPNFSKSKLPSLDALFVEQYIQEDFIREKLNSQVRAKNISEIENYLTNAIENDFIKFTPLYSKVEISKNKSLIQTAKEHAFKTACVELNSRRPKIKLKDIFEVQKDMPYEWVYKSYVKFSQYHKVWRTKGVSALHGSFGKPREYLVKLTTLAKAIIEKYYKHPNQYTIHQITDLVNMELSKRNRPTMSSATVSNYLKRPEIRNRLMMYRNTEVFNKTVQPILRRQSLKMSGDLYYADGTPLQIPCWNREMTKEIRLNLFAVIDVKSKKIVGFDLAESEDRFNVMSAFKMAFEMEGILPFELKHDNASATKTEEFRELKQMLELKGCRLTPTNKGNAQEKAQVERLFGTFQTSYQRMIDGFMGEGIRSKRENGRINTDHVNKLRKKGNLYTYESMVAIITNLINIYNQAPRDRRPSPSKVFADCEKLRTNKVDASDIAMLFWKHKEIKVSRGEIATTIRHTDYFYRIWDNDLKLKLSGQKVKMYYDERDLSTVHIFSTKGEYMCECKQVVMVHEGKAGQGEEEIKTLIKQSKHNESIKHTIRKKTSKVRKEAMEEIGDDFLDMLSPYHVSKERYNNAEGQILMNYVLDRNDIDRDRIKEYIPINTERKEYESEQRPKKSKRSPMAVSDNKMGIISLDDI